MPWQLKHMYGSSADSSVKKCLHSAHITFVTALKVSFSGKVEMICQENLKASIVKSAQIMNIPLTAAAFKEA